MSFISAILRTLTRLALFILAAVFTLLMLCVALLGLVFVLLKALFTGRKPEFITTFVRFNQASQQFRRDDWSNQQSAGDGFSATGEIIDVQAVEIRDDTALPHKPEDNKH